MTEIVVAGPVEAASALDAIMALEARVYEPSRRDPRARLALALQPRGLALLVRAEGELVGSVLAAPLERVRAVVGPEQDPERGRDSTLYTLALTVAPEVRGRGLGRALKTRQLEEARSLGYRFVSGRVRLGKTERMQRILGSLGAEAVSVRAGEYGGTGRALYYRIDLRR